MKLSSARIYLKRFALEDLTDRYVGWLNDPEVCRFNSHGEIEYTREKAAEFIRLLADDASCEVWAVYLKEPRLHIGNLALQNIDLQNKSAEIAYLFGEKEYWGQGYAKEASDLLIKRAFEDLKLHRLHFGTHSENLGMQRLGEKLGFLREGVRKEAQFKYGRYNDVVLFGLINHTDKDSGCFVGSHTSQCSA